MRAMCCAQPFPTCRSLAEPGGRVGSGCMWRIPATKPTSPRTRTSSTPGPAALTRDMPLPAWFGHQDWLADPRDPVHQAATYPEVITLTGMLASPHWRPFAMSASAADRDRFHAEFQLLPGAGGRRPPAAPLRGPRARPPVATSPLPRHGHTDDDPLNFCPCRCARSTEKPWSPTCSGSPTPMGLPGRPRCCAPSVNPSPKTSMPGYSTTTTSP